MLSQRALSSLSCCEIKGGTVDFKHKNGDSGDKEPTGGKAENAQGKPRA